MPRPNDHINVLMMPTDACNMDCVYCFHRAHRSSCEAMDLSVVEQVLKIAAPSYRQINFVWHGGEPLLMGLDFYRDVVALQGQWPSTRIKNSVQSNLTLMTEEYAMFFSEHHFRVSGSYDGVRNELTRGCSAEILEGRRKILESGKSCGFIMVLSRKNMDSLSESYRMFKRMGINFSLNLYVDQRDHSNPDLRLEAGDAVERLNSLFDEWALDANGTISISYFRHILDFLIGGRKSLCTYTSCMGRWIGVRHNGEIVPCNRYFPPQYSFGNVFDYTDIGQAFYSPGFQALIRQAIVRREACKTCELFPFCSGGCNNTAYNENGIDQNGGLSCQVLQGVYTHIQNFLREMDTSGGIRYNPVLLRYFKKTPS